jgi:hypothetical protein
MLPLFLNGFPRILMYVKARFRGKKRGFPGIHKPRVTGSSPVAAIQNSGRDLQRILKVSFEDAVLRSSCPQLYPQPRCKPPSRSPFTPFTIFASGILKTPY